MPGGDGTGPMGKGPGTGAGSGRCVSPVKYRSGQCRGGRCGSLRTGFGGQGGGRKGVQPINKDKS